MQYKHYSRIILKSKLYDHIKVMFIILYQKITLTIRITIYDERSILIQNIIAG
jgi:hypothetical protein